MKYSKKREQWEASNVTLKVSQTMDGLNVEAFSYEWWKFVAVINGKVVFNGYRYSNTTAKHQSKVRQKLSEMDIKIDFVVDTNKSLNDYDVLTAAINSEKYDIKELEEKLASNKRKKALDAERLAAIKEHEERILYIRRELMGQTPLAIAMSE